MKLPHLLPSLLFLPTVLQANHETITDVGGTVAPLTVNLTLSESIGTQLLTDAQKEALELRGFTYPELATFDTTYPSEMVAPTPTIRNPFGWDNTQGNYYVERVTTDASGDVVTAAGRYKITKSRYTNATLLADLAASGKIDSPTGYRIVVVRFDLDHEVHFTTTTQTENHTTHVNDHLYFFAERGAGDPAPVFLGAEYNDVYIYEQVVGLTRVTTIRSGTYTDVFTGDPVEGGFDYSLAGLNQTGTTAGEFYFFRPAPGEGAFYKINAQGLYRWSERYNARRQTYITGPINGTGLTGPAQGYFGLVSEDHDMVHTWLPNGGNQAVVTGAVRVAAATSHDSMLRYLNQLPHTKPH